MPAWLWPRSSVLDRTNTHGWPLPIPILQHPVLVFAVLAEGTVYNTRDEIVLGWFSLENHTTRGEGEAEVQDETRRTWDTDVLFAPGCPTYQ